MGEEVRISGGEDDYRVLEWEAGLPNVEDLTPLSQSLISADLLSAFSITPEPYRNMFDVNRASRNTLSNLRGELEQQSVSKLKSFGDDKEDEMVVEAEETADLTDSRKLQRVDNDGDGDGGGAGEEFDSDPSARASKRPRLVWTPQLHKRFVEVVAHLGVTNAVPKTIMQLMNVEGLSRENVASHLQKYRLYLKRMQTQGPSSSDQLFASTPAPQNLHQSSSAAAGNGYHHAPMHYQMVPMPYQSPQIDPNSAGGSAGAYHHGFESNSYPYNTTMQQRDWSGNNFGSVSAYQHRMTSNDK